MTRPPFDAEALVAMFENATARSGDALRRATHDATLAALKGRELTLKNIRGALAAVGEAAGAGASANRSGFEPAALLDQAVAGMDDALVKAVDAHRTALSQLVAQGADLREKHLKKALADLDKMEDTFFASVQKVATGAGAPLAAAWAPVLEKMQAGGSTAGAQATQAAEQMLAQMTDGVRATRAASVRAVQAMAESYAAMAGGVLVGMAEAMQAATRPAAKAPKK